MLIPNVVTLVALSAGITAIRFTFEGTIEWAVMAIGAAAVLDGLDGRIARALKGTSRFGAELDSLADFVDFGVAPAIVLYFSGLSQLHGLGWLICLLFAIACALRLARFNVMIDSPDIPAWRKGFFVGMPAPAGAVVGLLPVYLRVLGSSADDSVGRGWLGLEAVYVFAIAILMASRVPHFSGKSIGRVPREYVAVALIGARRLLSRQHPLRDPPLPSAGGGGGAQGWDIKAFCGVCEII
jgi:CDP-diacylglycerol--serine O-phosphatidyltransferase